ncbi:hypothetical protein ZHAS_00019377 [Anopheles sinensis]|uniref:Uncharacterized protein n=1 Tax=Anopheles sinensis TaxID=74873 RepID=A0A084WM79_ANOSI|nr:hypothetical protein ZHAS_00019377 [Anopheles sinensis]
MAVIVRPLHGKGALATQRAKRQRRVSVGVRFGVHPFVVPACASESSRVCEIVSGKKE